MYLASASNCYYAVCSLKFLFIYMLLFVVAHYSLCHKLAISNVQYKVTRKIDSPNSYRYNCLCSTVSCVRFVPINTSG